MNLIEFLVQIVKAIDESLGLNALNYRIALIYALTIMIAFIITMLYFRIKGKGSGTSKFVNTSFTAKILVYISVFALPVLEVCSRALIFGTDIGEHTLDVLQIFRNGHWLHSYKNPYYDLINVPAVMRAIIGIVITNDLTAHSPVNALIFNWSICLSLTLAILILLEKTLNITRKPIVFLVLIITALSNPYVSMSSNFIGLSFLLALLSLTFLELENEGRRTLITSSLLYLASLLTHGTGMFFLIPLFMYALYNIHRRQKIKSSMIHSLALYIIIIVVLTLMRFIYTTAYKGVRPYISETLGFMNRLQTGEVVLREVKWEAPVIPRITAISFSLLPSIALAPLVLLIVLLILRKIGILPLKYNREIFRHYQDFNNKFTYYWTFAISGLILILMAFVSSYFSRSFGRELGYPGMMMLIIPAAYTLNIILKGCNKKTYLIVLLVAIFVYLLGLATPAKTPWYEDYRTLTVHWRPAFKQYYLYSITILKLHDLTTPLTIYAEDKITLSYLYKLLYTAKIPKGLIRVHVAGYPDLNNIARELSVVYSANAPLDIVVVLRSK